jgi:hypothetical protein
MSRSLIRFGLWALLVLVVFAIVRETLSETSPLRTDSGEFLQQAIAVSLLVVGLGVVLLLIEKVFGKPRKHSRCATCGAPVYKRELYCRQHLRQVIHEEDDRTHEVRAPSS